MFSFQDLLTRLQDCVIAEDEVPESGSQLLRLFLNKLSESSRLVPNLSQSFKWNTIYTCKQTCAFLNKV